MTHTPSVYLPSNVNWVVVLGTHKLVSPEITAINVSCLQLRHSVAASTSNIRWGQQSDDLPWSTIEAYENKGGLTTSDVFIRQFMNQVEPDGKLNNNSAANQPQLVTGPDGRYFNSVITSTQGSARAVRISSAGAGFIVETNFVIAATYRRSWDIGQTMVMLGTNTSQTGWGLGCLTDAGGVFVRNFTGAGTHVSVVTTADSEWHTVIWQHTSAATSLSEVWVDGVLRDTKSPGAVPINSFCLGANGAINNTQFFRGQFRNAVIGTFSGTALLDEQTIMQIHRALTKGNVRKDGPLT